VLKTEALIVKSLSWQHTVIQNLKRLEGNDAADIWTIFLHLQKKENIDWEEDPFNVMEWLKKNLPGYVEDVAVNATSYLNRLKDIFPL